MQTNNPSYPVKSRKSCGKRGGLQYLQGNSALHRRITKSLRAMMEVKANPRNQCFLRILNTISKMVQSHMHTMRGRGGRFAKDMSQCRWQSRENKLKCTSPNFRMIRSPNRLLSVFVREFPSIGLNREHYTITRHQIKRERRRLECLWTYKELIKLRSTLGTRARCPRTILARHFCEHALFTNTYTKILALCPGTRSRPSSRALNATWFLWVLCFWTQHYFVPAQTPDTSARAMSVNGSLGHTKLYCVVLERPSFLRIKLTQSQSSVVTFSGAGE